MLKFEGKIKGAGMYQIPPDMVRIEGFLNGRHCCITIEAPGIARELPDLYGVDNKNVPIEIGNGEEL